jgi:hypothetical protein
MSLTSTFTAANGDTASELRAKLDQVLDALPDAFAAMESPVRTFLVLVPCETPEDAALFDFRRVLAEYPGGADCAAAHCRTEYGSFLALAVTKGQENLTARLAADSAEDLAWKLGQEELPGAHLRETLASAELARNANAFITGIANGVSDPDTLAFPRHPGPGPRLFPRDGTVYLAIDGWAGPRMKRGPVEGHNWAPSRHAPKSKSSKAEPS